jgi:predicted RND superfamily exporter protein
MAETISTDHLIVHQEKAALYRLGIWLIDHRKSVAVVAYAFTAVMLYFASRMEMFTSFGDLLPYRHPFVQVHTKFANQFGGANNINVMIEVKNGTVFNQD